MKKFVFMSVLMVFMVLSINLDFKSEKPQSFNLISISKVYAQDVVPVKIEVKEVVAEVSVIEIPEWVGSVVVFLKGVPYIGPYLVKALSYMGILAIVFTFLATLLMSISSLLLALDKAQIAPSWLGKAKKWIDILAKYAKYLSIYNVKKE